MPARVPPGTPAGGRFAPFTRAESGATLRLEPDAPEPASPGPLMELAAPAVDWPAEDSYPASGYADDAGEDDSWPVMVVVTDGRSLADVLDDEAAVASGSAAPDVWSWSAIDARIGRHATEGLFTSTGGRIGEALGHLNAPRCPLPVPETSLPVPGVYHDPTCEAHTGGESCRRRDGRELRGADDGDCFLAAARASHREAV